LLAVIRRIVLSAALVLAATFVMPAAPAEATVTPRATACGRHDLRETGIQGEVPMTDQLDGRARKGYNCGLALVGHASLGGIAANMAWAGHCAYVATLGDGVNVVDVSDPQHPKRTELLRGPGSQSSLETIAARQVGNHAVLVAGRYGYYAHTPVTSPMDIYDASDCAHPRFVTTFRWPENIHNLTISSDGTRVFGTLPLQEADISNLAHPRYLGDLEKALFKKTPTDNFRSDVHDVQVSADGNTVYFGGQTPASYGFTIADIRGFPQRAPHVLSHVAGRGHSVNLANIGGKTYVVHSEESIVSAAANGCISQTMNPVAGPAQPWLSDVNDATHPRMRVSQMTLAINRKSNCVRELADGENASVHYHDVDDPNHTTFVMASMWNAGLRVFDVRDPLHPREAAYFNPGSFLRLSDDVTLDKAWGHVHYDAAAARSGSPRSRAVSGSSNSSRKCAPRSAWQRCLPCIPTAPFRDPLRRGCC
jgi:LVIVD repeat-containing protein